MFDFLLLVQFEIEDGVFLGFVGVFDLLLDFILLTNKRFLLDLVGVDLQRVLVFDIGFEAFRTKLLEVIAHDIEEQVAVAESVDLDAVEYFVGVLERLVHV